MGYRFILMVYPGTGYFHSVGLCFPWEGYKSGADICLAKPFDIDSLFT